MSATPRSDAVFTGIEPDNRDGRIMAALNLAIQLEIELAAYIQCELPTAGYYLQDKRKYDGNDMFWWAKDGNGYTTDLRKAHVYNEEQFAKGASRETDVFWPVQYINNLARPTVDMQYAKRLEAFKA
jgi:hypothetical protein